MVDAVTNNRNITQPTVGGDVGTWGGILNTGVMAQLDLILGATQPIAITVADVTLSIAQWNNCAIKLTGALTGNRSLILPFNFNSLTVAVGGLFVVDNETTGAFSVTVKTAAAGSTGVTIPQGLRAYLYSDTVNVWYADDEAAHIIPWAGNPNGFVAGTAGTVNNPPSVVWDYTNAVLYFCTTTGNAAAAVWTQSISPVSRGFNAPINLELSVTHTGGNLLNVAVKTLLGSDPTLLNPVICAFQTVSGANTTGAVANLNITSALSMTTNSLGATLGSLNNTPFRFWIAIFNNGGTPVLALRNCSTATGIFSNAEYGVASTVAISGTATSAGVWYTPNGTALTNCAFRLIGYCEYTIGNLLATAGTFSADPSNTVVFGPGIKKPGDLIQSIYSHNGAYLTTTNTYTPSATAPVAANGVSVVSQAITPSSAINHLRINAAVAINTNTTSTLSAYLVDATNTATRSVAYAFSFGAAAPNSFSLYYETLSNTVSAITYTLYGAGSSGTTYINGYSGTQYFAGAANTYIEIEEIMG